ncbi:MAG: xanthine dehydrogenase family protein molybdopterin-binding subunit [Deltaproteobacteria bacterium]|nr:xanthine dehydrogenase family protein molybdopterin-binding subunit [Deltaproteobacteria bacterium]
MADRFEEMPSNPMVRDKFIHDTFEFLGKRGMRRIDGLRKASGRAVYTRDIILPGMLYARWMKSPYPNAKIVSMDSSRAEKLPGVRAILRYDDPEICEKRIPALQGGEEDVLIRYAHFQGQPMGAVVAADTEEIAKEALKLIHVEWEQRPFVLDPREAIALGAPLARPERMPEGNEMPLFFQPTNTFSFGDVNKGFKEADEIIEFKARRRYHGCSDAEPVNGITRWEEDCVELWLHMQHPYEHKWMMYKWFGVPMTKVKINSPYNGAMFGGWNWIDYSMIPQYISALLSRRTGRPVKWVFNRRDDFIFGSLDAMESDFRVGFKRDGTITAVKIKSIFVNLSFEPGLHFVENCKIPNVESETLVVQVNKGPVHAIRCEQLPPSFALTHVFNHVAAELNMDPTELALQNDGAEGEDMAALAEFKRKNGFPVRDSLRECIEAGKKAIGWDEKWHLPGAKKLPNGKMHGIGFIWDHEWDDNRGAGAAGLMIQQDGTVSVIALRADVGVNAESTYCAIVAEELGMRYEDVFLRQQDDVHLPLMTPDGSCNLTTNGYVMKKIAKRAKKQLLELATSTVHLIERDIPPAFPDMSPDDLEVRDSVIYVKDNPSIKKTVAEVVKDVGGSLGSFIKKHEYGAIQNTTHPPVYAWAHHRQGRLGKEPGRQRLCRQAHFCEVEVDPETGDVEVTKVVNVNDVGKALSPEGVEGQQYGGTYMGVGRNRSEEYVWDPKTGVLLNGNLVDYKFSSLLDVGPIETVIVETGMGLGPYGTVGIGEDVATDTTYLLHGAVYNAIGKWVDDGPITPDKVLKALGKA